MLFLSFPGGDGCFLSVTFDIMQVILFMRRDKMPKKTIAVGALIAALILSVSCRTRTQVKGVELNVSFSEEELTDNLLTEMIYTWKTNSEFEKINQDMFVFVHIWHGDNLLIQDDHSPELPTSEWEADKIYEYKREIYIPAFIDKFDPSFNKNEFLRFSVGFYSPYDRTGESEMQILEERIKVFPQPFDTPEIIYEEGWYDLEVNPDTYLKQWRWTAKQARCIIDNPYRDALLIIKGGIQEGVFEQQKVIFRINNLILDEFIPQEFHFEKSYDLKAEMLGEKDEFILTIETDKTFIPAERDPESKDIRELGVVISFIYFR
jgi:hypothetical protein